MLIAPMRRHPLVSYFVIAYALSWAVWIPMAMVGARAYQGQGWPSHIPGLLGPLTAALIVSAVMGRAPAVRDLLGRMVRWRVQARWYLVALSPLGFYAIVTAVQAAMGRGWPELSLLGKFTGLPIVAPALMLLLLVLAGYAEETGWRGFAVDQMLEKRSLLTTAVVVGLLWALWHVPSFFVVENYREMGLGILPMFTLGIVCGSIVLAWLYREAGASILIVALWHGTYDLVSGTAAAHGMVAAIVSTGVMVWAGLILVAELRRWQANRVSPGRSRPDARATNSGETRFAEEIP